jgi:Rrf2 family protein
MRLMRATQCALRALAYLAREGGKGPVPAHEIARAACVPHPFLVKALTPLVAAGLLYSYRSRNSVGYRLARPAKEITLLEVVEAVEGPLRGEAPGVGAAPESKRFNGRLQAACENAATLVRQQFRRVTLAELSGK